MLSSGTASPLVFPYPRSISPGHPDRLQSIRDKCWIASRSQPAWAGWPRRPWRVPRGPPRASQEALGPRIRASWDPGSGSWDPRIRAPGPRILAIPGSPAARDLDIPASSDKSVG